MGRKRESNSTNASRHFLKKEKNTTNTLTTKLELELALLFDTYLHNK